MSPLSLSPISSSSSPNPSNVFEKIRRAIETREELKKFVDAVEKLVLHNNPEELMVKWIRIQYAAGIFVVKLVDPIGEDMKILEKDVLTVNEIRRVLLERKFEILAMAVNAAIDATLNIIHSTSDASLLVTLMEAREEAIKLAQSKD